MKFRIHKSRKRGSFRVHRRQTHPNRRRNTSPFNHEYRLGKHLSQRLIRALQLLHQRQRKNPKSRCIPFGIRHEGNGKAENARTKRALFS